MEENKYTLNDLLEENRALREMVECNKRVCDLFLEICQGMGAIPDTDKLSTFFIAKLPELFNVKRASFMLLEEKTGELFIKAAQGLSSAALAYRTRLGEGFGGRVAQDGKSLLVKDIEKEFPGLAADRLSRYASKSFIIVPVKIKDEVIGVISLTEKNDQGIFNDGDLKILNLISQYFSLRIENIRLTQKNDNLIDIDHLTGLFNHRYFYEQLSEEIYRSERYHHSFGLLLLDIDNFSVYNQAQGYAAGDNVLKQLAGIIKKNIRQADIACRFGLEEFAVILPETGLSEAMAAAEKIRIKISEALFTENRTSALDISRFTVSIGVAVHKVGLEKEELVRRATYALSEAKQKGKNKACSFKGGGWFIQLKQKWPLK